MVTVRGLILTGYGNPGLSFSSEISYILKTRRLCMIRVCVTQFHFSSSLLLTIKILGDQMHQTHSFSLVGATWLELNPHARFPPSHILHDTDFIRDVLLFHRDKSVSARITRFPLAGPGNILGVGYNADQWSDC